MASIFVAIPTLEDPEYFNTLISCYEQSSGKNEIYIGSAYNVLFNNKKIIKEVEKNIPDIPNLQIKFINTNKSRGVGYGRLESMSFYEGQDYFLQVDSHTLFLKDWDQILIDALHEAKDYFSLEKILLTGYAWSYELISKDERIPLQETTTPMYPFYLYLDEHISSDKLWTAHGKDFFKTYGMIPKWETPPDKKEYEVIKNKFEMANKVNANLLFAEKNFAEIYTELFPWPFGFFEEEFIMTIESIKRGWIPVFPNFDVNVCHHYVDEFNEFYPGRESLYLSKEDLGLIKKKIDRYLQDNADVVDKYFQYVCVDKETRFSTKRKYIPRVEDLWILNS